MIVPDLNLLIYATNEASPVHERARDWWRTVLTGEESCGLDWVVVLGFLRLTTSPRVFSKPFTPSDAWATVDQWLQSPPVSIVHPGESHYAIARIISLELGLAGNLTTDIHLAALCMEQGAVLHTRDGDFGRFASLKWHNPID